MTDTIQRRLRGIPARLAAVMCAALLLAPLTRTSGQGLSVRMSEANFSGLPRVTLKLCTQAGGSLMRGLDSSNFRLFENGIPRPLTVRCPDPLGVNSVMLVLDNSGSMLPVMPKLIEAASLLVDSLGATDECAIVSFGNQVVLRQDFTTDKALLKTTLAGLLANGGTRLFDAALEGVQRLAGQTGNRSAVIITDGEDNLSTSSDDDVIAAARNANAKLYTIAFNISDANQNIMRRMATSTGGSFFIVVRPSELNAVYRQIAAEITEKCCLAEYLSDRCDDSVRTLLVTARAFGDSATDVQTFATPSRPTTARLVVNAPATLKPFESGMAAVDLDPAPSQALELTLSFTLVYDDNLVEVIPRLPLTLGTVAQNQVVDMTKIGPGRLRLTFARIKPALAVTRLVAFPVQGLLSDSSRKVEMSIADIALEGCPMAITAVPDTIELCQCERPLAALLDSLSIFAVGDVVAIPVRIAGGLDPAVRLIAEIDLRIPPSLDVLGVDEGTLLPASAFRWRRIAPDMLRIDMPEPAFPLAAGGLLATVRLGTGDRRETDRLQISFMRAAMWQRCCPDDTSRPESIVMIDGYCEKLLQRRADTPTLSAAPNPVSPGRTQRVPLRVSVPVGLASAPATIDLVSPGGMAVRRLFDGPLPSGAFTVFCDIAGLPSGAYLVSLHAPGAEAVFRLMVVE
ncbi:MAG: VWA domain-containing protein [Ignavibacteria bacterium]|nr:VWA domain-containing protein [Ignavibacteria bacterium]